jgi:8-oxo-dGTP diphosphatase
MKPSPKPAPEAGCGAAIRDDQGRILLILRLKEPEAGCWGLPGGKIDFGETARETARREIAEELGVEIDVMSLACVTETIDQGDGRHWVAPVFEARIISGTPRILEPHKLGGWGWYSLDALPGRLAMSIQTYIQSIEN